MGKVLLFVGGRLAMMVVTLVVASVAIYGALFLAPGNPATLLAGGHATPQLIAAIERQEHLNQSFFVRYWDWLVGLLHGNLGTSFVYREPVTVLLAGRVLNTVFLVVYASVLIIVVRRRTRTALCPASSPRGRHHGRHERRSRHAVVRGGHRLDHGVRR